MKNYLSKSIKFLKDKDYRFDILSNFGFYNFMDDEEYLSKKYYSTMNRKLDLENPKTFNEKLQWLKLYNRKDLYTKVVDKYLVREYIKEKLGEEYLIPLIGIWDDPDDIDFNKMPNQFVLKCNHNSGLGMCICKDKSKLDISKVKRDLRKGLKQDYYLTGREWPYKNVPRKIIAEKFMVDNDSNGTDGELTDYKFFCFNGYVDCVMVCLERSTNKPKYYFFDKNWKLLRINIRGKNAPKDFTLTKPDTMDEMFKIAENLSKGMPFVRVDLYECNKKIYFGELTFFPDSGFDANLLPETDIRFGKLLDLTNLRNSINEGEV